MLMKMIPSTVDFISRNALFFSKTYSRKFIIAIKGNKIFLHKTFPILFGLSDRIPLDFLNSFAFFTDLIETENSQFLFIVQLLGTNV